MTVYKSKPSLPDGASGTYASRLATVVMVSCKCKQIFIVMITHHFCFLSVVDRQPCLLHAVQIKTLTLLDCITQWPGKIFGSMFCAGGVRQGTCFRDSGGPLIETKGTVIGPYEQIGVTSWGSKTCSKPQVYTRVQKFIEWITKICGNSFTCPPYSPWTTIKLNETLQLSS
nr:chymotrypsin-like protease CTRL-1 [Penaeus vannamei]